MIRLGQWKLIHYYEDGRNELYDLNADIGEQSDLSLTHPATADALWGQLDQWLTETNARRPKPDPRYNAETTQRYYQSLQTATKQRLEKFHKQILEPNWQPSKNWWGSAPSID